MSYDSNYEPPVYTRNEMDETVRQTTRAAFNAGYAEAMNQLCRMPLSVWGRWEHGKVYDPHSVVYHKAAQWLAVAQTAGEPGNTDAWQWLARVENIPPAEAAQPKGD